MMRFGRYFMAALAFAGFSWPAGAADFSDPTWPCVQRKVEALSPGLMWAHPLAEAHAPDAEISELAGLLGLRRFEVEELRPEAEAFAARHNGNPAILGEVFSEAFEALSKRRSRIISGIGEFSLSQITLAEQIDKARSAMDAEMAMADPDFDKVDKLEEEIDWRQLIYTDRQRSLTYLCETPQIIERRLFAIAQMLQGMVKDGG